MYSEKKIVRILANTMRKNWQIELRIAYEQSKTKLNSLLKQHVILLLVFKNSIHKKCWLIRCRLIYSLYISEHYVKKIQNYSVSKTIEHFQCLKKCEFENSVLKNLPVMVFSIFTFFYSFQFILLFFVYFCFFYSFIYSLQIFVYFYLFYSIVFGLLFQIKYVFPLNMFSCCNQILQEAILKFDF